MSRFMRWWHKQPPPKPEPPRTLMEEFRREHGIASNREYFGNTWKNQPATLQATKDAYAARHPKKPPPEHVAINVLPERRTSSTKKPRLEGFPSSSSNRGSNNKTHKRKSSRNRNTHRH